MKEKIHTVFFVFFLFTFSVHISNAQWVQVNNGLGNLRVVSLVSSGNTVFAGTQDSGVYLSSNYGETWTHTSLNNQDVRSLVANDNYIFAGSYSGNGVFRSSDNGVTWTQTSLNDKTIRAMAIIGNSVYAGTYTPSTGVYKSTDNGTVWTLTSLNNQVIRSMAVNESNVYAGSGGSLPGNGIYLSTNIGENWTQTSLNSAFIGSLAVDGNNVFAGSGNSGGIFKSTDNCATWTQNFLNNSNVYALKINGNNIYAGTYNFGVYVSNDYGTSWMQKNEGLFFNGAQVNDLCILNNYLFAGLGIAGNVGVYRRPLGELTVIKPISNEIPNIFSLSQNYPNPFNPVTKIKFALPNSSFAKIVIYNELGKEMETIVNEQLNAGTYEAVWSAGKFSSGIYFYKLTTPGFSELKKMILLK